MRILLRIRGFLRDGLIVVALLLMRPSWPLFACGLGLLLVGALLHVWSKACLVRNREVTTWGPYRVVRHPFYLANFVIDTGICLMSGNLYLIAAYIPAFLLAYIPTIRFEETNLRAQHGAAYDEFARRVPMLIPYRVTAWFGGLDAAWANFRNESELPRLLRILCIPLFFLIADAAYYRVLFPGGTIVPLIAMILPVVILQTLSLLAKRSLTRSHGALPRPV